MTVLSFFDYNCVFCYIGRRRLKEAAQRVGAEVKWVAWRMPGDASPPPKPADYREGVKAYIAAAAAELGLAIHLMPPTDTLDALTGMYYAREQGCEEAYHQQVFDARFLRKMDLSRRDVLAQCAAEAGLDPKRYLEILGSEAYRSRAMQDFEEAARRKIWTIPSYVLGDREIQVHHYEQMPTADDLAEWLRFGV
ncbi:MAG: DsbA family protein [Alicyclobacillaceae bacterium]|nr:DsbA family protein [Alicyclobacillaceae bacterium]